MWSKSSYPLLLLRWTLLIRIWLVSWIDIIPVYTSMPICAPLPPDAFKCEISEFRVPLPCKAKVPQGCKGSSRITLMGASSVPLAKSCFLKIRFAPEAMRITLPGRMITEWSIIIVSSTTTVPDHSMGAITLSVETGWLYRPGLAPQRFFSTAVVATSLRWFSTMTDWTTIVSLANSLKIVGLILTISWILVEHFKDYV